MRKFVLSIILFSMLSYCIGAQISFQTLPYQQNWSSATATLGTNNYWPPSMGVMGFASNKELTMGTDPQTLLTEDGSANLLANQTDPATTDPSINTTFGVAEFQIADPVIALCPNPDRDTPSLVFYLNSTTISSTSLIKLSYTLRDIDDSARNTVQPIAVQYRVGSVGSFTNIPEAFVADATVGPNLTQSVDYNVVLPAECSNQAKLYIRFITAYVSDHADEWVGIDNVKLEEYLTPVELSGFDAE